MPGGAKTLSWIYSIKPMFHIYNPFQENFGRLGIRISEEGKKRENGFGEKKLQIL